MKHPERIKQIDAKIAELQKLQKQLEEEYVSEISKEITKIFVKHKAFNLDKNTLLKEIDNLIAKLSAKQ